MTGEMGLEGRALIVEVAGEEIALAEVAYESALDCLDVVALGEIGKGVFIPRILELATDDPLSGDPVLVMLMTVTVVLVRGETEPTALAEGVLTVMVSSRVAVMVTRSVE